MQEKAQRRAVFEKNAALISEHNARNSEVVLALNAFADLTWEEFSRSHLGYAAPAADNRCGRGGHEGGAAPTAATGN